MDSKFTAVARVGRLFGDISSGGVSLSLYTTLPEDFDPATDALFVEIDSLPVPLYCDKFERRGVSGANVCFADFDTQRRAEELVGKELYMELCDEEGDDDEFYMEDLIGFAAEVVDEQGARVAEGRVSDYYDSEANPLFELELNGREVLVPAVEDFIVHIDFEGERMIFLLPEGLMEL